MERVSPEELFKRIRSAFHYDEATGRLTRVTRGLGARVGVQVGSIHEYGHRRAFFAGRNRMTAHMVWAWVKGEMPTGILRHSNGDNADDRVENLALIKKTPCLLPT